LYYYKGIPSWSWYYDNYYSPLVSDLFEYLKIKNAEGGMEKLVNFVKDTPYTPF